VIDRLQSLLDGLRAERRLPQAERSTGAADRPLDAAIDQVSRAHDLLEAGHRDAAAALLAEVAHHATDSWSYTSELAVEVVACSQRLGRR